MHFDGCFVGCGRLNGKNDHIVEHFDGNCVYLGDKCISIDIR